MVAKRMSEIFRKYSDKIVLFFYPLILVLINSNWIFTPAMLSPDPWFYFAFFRYFNVYAPSYPSNVYYFVERLTWNVPGFYIYKIFQPELANYIIHLLVYYVAVFSLYGILKILFGRRTALISALLMGSYPWFLRAVGWDYVDGVGIAQLLLLFYLLALSIRSKHWKPILFLGGIVHASLLITNQFWLGFAPAWIAFFLLMSFKNKKIDLKRLLYAGIFFFLGNLLLTLSASFYYHLVAGHYNFLKNSLSFAQKISSDENNVREVLKFYGQMPSYWHLLPMLFASLGVRQLFRKQKEIYHYEFLTIIIVFLLSYLWLIFWHYFKIPYLIVYLYSSYIIPATFLLFGALIYPIVDQLSERHFQQLIVPIMLVMAAPLLLCSIVPSIDSLQGNRWILIGVTISIFVLFAFTKLYRKEVFLLFFIGTSLIFYQSAAKIDIGVYTHDPSLNRNNFLTLIDASRDIDAYYPGHKYLDFRLWFRAEENLISHIPLASIYLYPWGSSINMSPSGQFEWPKNAQLHEGNIVLISADSDPQRVVEDANKALIPFNSKLIYQSSKRIEHGDLDTTLTFTKLEINPITLDYGKKYEFDFQPSAMDNWFSQENNGKSYMWSGPKTRSDIQFVLPQANSNIEIQFCVIMALKPAIPKNLKVFINETPVTVALTETPDCLFLYSGAIQSNIISVDPLKTVVSFQVDETISPKDLNLNADERKLGLAFDWLKFERLR
jgi:hypothetical protein